MTCRRGAADWRLVVRLAATLAFVGVAVVGTTRFIARPWVVAGPSMEPTLRDGDRVIVDLWCYRNRDPRAGEIVLFAAPSQGGTLVKRVAEGPLPGREIGEPDFTVLGDNASESLDSRAFGPIGRGRIRGRVVFRYWPPSRAGPIE